MDYHAIGIYMVVLLPLLSSSVKRTVLPSCYSCQQASIQYVSGRAAASIVAMLAAMAFASGAL